MSWLRANSSPDLHPAPAPPATTAVRDDLIFEGLVVNAKLLLKLIQDHGDASGKKDDKERREKRVAGMIAIMDDMRVRVEKSQSAGKKREAELRRCNTDLRRGREKKGTAAAEAGATAGEEVTGEVEEKQKMRKELSAAMAARKNLEMMCSSMGKEKEIMAGELARKAQELIGMEELVSDLRAQNENLLGKVRACTGEHMQRGEAALQEKNKALSEQLLKALDGYRALKRRVKEVQAENAGLRGIMEELRAEVGRFRGRWVGENEDMMADMSVVEGMLEGFHLKEERHSTGQRQASSLSVQSKK